MNSQDLEKMITIRKSERLKLVFPKKKKLIQMGHGWASLPYIHERIREMEEKPFDGIALRLKKEDVFNPEAWNEEDFLEDYHNLAEIKWEKFTDNFIWTVCNAPLDFFNENQWQNVLHNTRICAKAALLGRCAGIVFDPEDYGVPLFSYPRSPRHDTKTYEKYEARIKQCGEEWIRAIEEILPNPRIFDLWLTGSYVYGHDRNLWNGKMTPEEARAALSKLPYGLVPAFVNGMLKAAGPKTIIIDGNEGAYWYESSEEHISFARYNKEILPKAYINPALWPKYQKQVQCGSSYYNGFCYGTFPGSLAREMNDDEKCKWLEHNVFWALKTCDEYTWEWAEGMKWWENKLPPYYAESIISARNKLFSNQPLGYSIEYLFENAKKRVIEKRLEGKIQKIKKNEKAPLIDGKINDSVWGVAEFLSDFIPFAEQRPHKSFLPTLAKVLYDNKKLYMAFECMEPEPDKMKLNGGVLNGSGFLADDYIQIVITSAKKKFPVYHFMLNAKTLIWTCVYIKPGSSPDISYVPKWEYATYIGKEKWSAEVAIPWEAIKIKTPKKGMEVLVNMGRHRSQTGERTCWSPSFCWEPLFPRYDKATVNPEMFGSLMLE